MKWNLENILTRIAFAQQKLHETNLGQSLRSREKSMNEFKVEMKNLDQELVMIKIEMALIKCQIEESVMDQMEMERKMNIAPEDENVENDYGLPRKYDHH